MRLAVLLAIGLSCAFTPSAAHSRPLPWDDSFRVQLTRAGSVHTVHIQSDESILIHGDFQWVGLEARNGIARLNPDGTLDGSFDPASRIPGTPLALALLADGKILIGSRVQWNQLQLYRCHPDGALDASFDNAPGFGRPAYSGYDRMQILPLPDGRVLVGGFFRTFGTITRLGVARLLPDGSLDPDFDAGSATDDMTEVIGLAADGDNGYLVATRRADTQYGFLRLQSNGTAISLPLTEEEEQRVRLPVLSDGRRVIVAGSTLTFFSPSGAVGEVWSNIPAFAPINSRHYAAITPDGKLLISGIAHDLPGGRANFGLVRLLRDGSLDPEFAMPGGISVPNQGVHQVSLDLHGRVMVRGDFSLVNGVRRGDFARLNPDGTLDPSFEFQGALFPGERFALTPEGGLLTDAVVWSEHTGESHYSLWRFRPDGVRDGSFGEGNSGADFFCERIFNVALHPRGEVLLTTVTGTGCTANQQWPFLRLVRASDRTELFSISPLITSDLLDSYYPGRIEHIVPHPLDGSTYVAGIFTHLDDTPRAGVARLLSDGTVDPDFEFQHTWGLQGNSTIGAAVESDGRLTLLTTDIDDGYLLIIQEDGSLAAKVRVSTPLSSFPLATLRYSDGSWVVASRPSPSAGVSLQRIGADGRLLARRTVPFAAPVNKLALALDDDQRVLVGASDLPTSNGSWSGLLRFSQLDLAPVTLALASPAGRTLAVRGPPGQRVKLQTSSDLISWSDWVEETLSSTGTSGDIASAHSQDRLFYRAVVVAD